MGDVINLAVYKQKRGIPNSTPEARSISTALRRVLEEPIEPVFTAFRRNITTGTQAWHDLFNQFISILECMPVLPEPSGIQSSISLALLSGFPVRIGKITDIGDWQICIDSESFVLIDQGGNTRVKFPSKQIQSFYLVALPDDDDVSEVFIPFPSYEALSRYSSVRGVQLPQETELREAILNQIWRERQ